MAVNEISDAIEPDSGYSMQDIIMNVAGAAFSALRNTTPGMKEKLAFKLEIVPNDQIYSHVGKKHYEPRKWVRENYGNANSGKRFFKFIRDNFADRVALPKG